MSSSFTPPPSLPPSLSLPLPHSLFLASPLLLLHSTFLLTPLYAWKLFHAFIFPSPYFFITFTNSPVASPLCLPLFITVSSHLPSSLSLFFILPPTSSFSSSSSLVFSSYSDHTLSAAGFSDASALRIIPPHSVVMFYFGCCVFSPFCYIRRKC